MSLKINKKSVTRIIEVKNKQEQEYTENLTEGNFCCRYNSKLTTLALPSVIFEPKFRGSVRNLVYSDGPGQPPRRQELRHSRDLKVSFRRCYKR